MSEHAVRKRNVKTRNRTGCVTCRARRLKCDEGKPECNNCTKLNLPCGGYPPRLVFKDQTDLFSQKTPQTRRTRSSKARAKEEEKDHAEPAVTGDAFTLLDQRPQSDQQDAQDAVVGAAPFDDGAPIGTHTPSYPTGQPSSIFDAASSLTLVSGSPMQEEWGSSPGFNEAPGPPASSCEPERPFSSVSSPTSAAARGPSSLNPVHGASEASPAQALSRCDSEDFSCVHASYHGIQAAPVVPQGLLQGMKFTEDMLYYHHLRDPSPYGVLSVLYLTDLLDAPYLDGSFYHAALALSALKITQSDASSHIRRQASIHALEHFVTALGSIGKIHVEEDSGGNITPGTADDPQKQEKAISWLSTVLFLAYFELQRGQMRLWYVHSRAAVDFLSQHFNLVLGSKVGESLIRAFSRIAALLDIYDRTHSMRKRVTSSGVSDSLVQSLTTSTQPYDRLLYIMPRVNQLEEEWRSNPRLDLQFQQRIEALKLELEQWREGLPASDVPPFDDEASPDSTDDAQGPGLKIKPCTILQSYEPARAATNYAHYLVSLLRLDSMYPPGTDGKLSADEFTAILHKVCRLAAGVPYTLCVRVNAYGHGMLPALMNACYMSDSPMADWIRNWITCIPGNREGIWNVSRVQRLLSYLDQEYGREGSRSGSTIIKARMVDLEDDGADPLDEGESNSFCVEIYSKGKRGWSIDFVEIE